CERRSDELMTQIREKYASSAEYRRVARNDDNADAQLTGDRCRVQRASAAGHHQSKLHRIFASVIENALDSTRHVDVDHIVDGHRCLLGGQTQRPCDVAVKHRFCRARVERHAASEETSWIDV